MRSDARTLLRYKLKMPSRLWCSVLVCALSGFLGGVSLSSFSGLLELPSFNRYFTLTTADKSLLSAALLFGAFFCTIIAGPIVDSKGTRLSLLIAAFLFSVGSVIITFSRGQWYLGIGRILSGCGYAISNIASPAYLTQVAPAAYRAIFINIYQASINAGIVSAQVANALSVPMKDWWYASVFPVFPALIMLVLLLTLFENEPTQGTKSDARASFALIRADESSSRRLAISCGVMFAQQATSINSIIFYAPAIVMSMGMGSKNALSAPFWAAVLVGGANFVASLLATGFVDQVGRRQLFVRGGIIICISLCLLGFVRWNGGPSILALVVLISFIAGFAVAWGPLPFLVSAEVLPQQWRGLGLTIAGLTSHASSFCVVYSFLLLEKTIGSSTYALFALIMTAVTLCIIKWLPETKDKTLLEIDRMFQRDPSAAEFP